MTVNPSKLDPRAIGRIQARKAHLRYVSDAEPGIERRKAGDEFVYDFKGRPVKDPAQLSRIKSLAIPPAWQEVWICCMPNGHLQATGKDARNRKQYRYHPQWSSLRNETKFHHMIDLGLALPKLRARVRQDLNRPGLSQDKVIATVIQLMENTHIRIGNHCYEKENGSHGITTLKDRHVQFEKDAIRFAFKGKKGISHSINLRNKKLARIVRQCRDIPGKELFQYMNADGSHMPIDSGMVNEYIKNASGGDFSAKDLRTWAGTLHAYCALISLGPAETKSQLKKNVLQVLDEVSHKLGNTRTVCRKYYVDPLLITLYENGELKGEQCHAQDNSTSSPQGLSQDEMALLSLLQKHG